MAILEPTHANRWIVRERRTRPVIGIITRLDDRPANSRYRAMAWHSVTEECFLLRDSDCLEIAFARILAHHARTPTAAETVEDLDSSEDAVA